MMTINVCVLVNHRIWKAENAGDFMDGVGEIKVLGRGGGEVRVVNKENERWRVAGDVSA